MENIVGQSITQEMKNDLVCSWNEVEEAKTSLEEVVETTPEVKAIIERLESVLHFLGKYVTDEDVLENLK
jgi:hypothetical protein